MKKLLLWVLLPLSSNAMDPSWQKWISDAWNALHPMAKQAVFEVGLKAAGEVQQNIRQAAANKSYQRQVEAHERDQQKAAQIAQQEARKKAAKASVMSEEQKAGREFDRCLNDNFACKDLSGLGIPRRCNSPARRYSLYNPTGVEMKVAAFKQRRTKGGAA